MSDNSNDDPRLRATEAQMRRALGLLDGPAASTQPSAPASPSNTVSRPPRRFVRDGEVPVSVIHRDEPSGTNQLEAARRTIRTLTAAKDVAERSLAEAQVTIRDLRTKLAHERLARDEAVNRLQAEGQAALAVVRAELATEQESRRRAEERLAEALASRQEAEQRLRQMVAAETVPQPLQGRPRGRPRKHPVVVETDESPAPVADVVPMKPRRGRPPEVQETESEFVEWWKPGWKERLRQS